MRRAAWKPRAKPTTTTAVSSDTTKGESQKPVAATTARWRPASAKLEVRSEMSWSEIGRTVRNVA